LLDWYHLYYNKDQDGRNIIIVGQTSIGSTRKTIQLLRKSSSRNSTETDQKQLYPSHLHSRRQWIYHPSQPSHQNPKTGLETPQGPDHLAPRST